MPVRPPKYKPPGAHVDADYDRERRALVATRRLYGTTRWRAKRADQLRREPLCCLCLAAGIAVAANTADHVIPHRGDVVLFWEGELQSLCPTCHSSTKQRDEARASAGARG